MLVIFPANLGQLSQLKVGLKGGMCHTTFDPTLSWLSAGFYSRKGSMNSATALLPYDNATAESQFGGINFNSESLTSQCQLHC
jgi:hypothetical protein